MLLLFLTLVAARDMSIVGLSSRFVPITGVIDCTFNSYPSCKDVICKQLLQDATVAFAAVLWVSITPVIDVSRTVLLGAGMNGTYAYNFIGIFSCTNFGECITLVQGVAQTPDIALVALTGYC